MPVTYFSRNLVYRFTKDTRITRCVTALAWYYAATFLVTAKIALCPFAYAESVRNLKIEFACLCE